ncbi:M48 family metalloprotease [Winogradskyella maritima]|uniref:M48 family metalloprotease n=1 Tax=Winogradskyella maritima TaxID=1517766 RepID=A0ABV8AMF7_9FLAO|nr:M48 family metalloprotease [Winogradskyella maritima]MDO1502568.1 M48 family metalloprotease [Winogradskyella maritima]
MEAINKKHLKRINGRHASKVRDVFKGRDELVFKQINDSAFFFNTEFDKYVNHVLDEIYSNNPSVDTSDFKFFLRNSIAPNASCYGDGMFDIHLGLFDTLKSDDEFAFVLCHEIAHKILEHPLNNVTNAISRLNSDETKAQLKTIKRQKYGQTRSALSVIDELNIDFLAYSRAVESQADSLGFILFKNTKYNQASAISALKGLDLKDDILLSHPVNIEDIFNFPEYPFKDYWLEEEVSIFNTSEKINDYQISSDTLKTHPEIPFRIGKLIRENAIDTTSNVPIGSEKKKIEQLIHNRSIQAFIDIKQLDLALYQLVKKFQEKNIDKESYIEKMLLILKQTYLARQKHELGKYVQPKNKFSKEKELNKIRIFLHNLEYREIVNLGKYFYTNCGVELPEETINQFRIFVD